MRAAGRPVQDELRGRQPHRRRHLFAGEFPAERLGCLPHWPDANSWRAQSHPAGRPCVTASAPSVTSFGVTPPPDPSYNLGSIYAPQKLHLGHLLDRGTRLSSQVFVRSAFSRPRQPLRQRLILSFDFSGLLKAHSSRLEAVPSLPSRQSCNRVRSIHGPSTHEYQENLP